MPSIINEQLIYIKVENNVLLHYLQFDSTIYIYIFTTWKYANFQGLNNNNNNNNNFQD